MWVSFFCFFAGLYLDAPIGFYLIGAACLVADAIQKEADYIDRRNNPPKN